MLDGFIITVRPLNCLPGAAIREGFSTECSATLPLPETGDTAENGGTEGDDAKSTGEPEPAGLAEITLDGVGIWTSLELASAAGLCACSLRWIQADCSRGRRQHACPAPWTTSRLKWEILDSSVR